MELQVSSWTWFSRAKSTPLKRQAMEKVNIFLLIPKVLKSEQFLRIATGENVEIERIVSRGHSSPGESWYDQARSEWVILLKGAARLEFDGGPVVELSAGDYVNIPARSRHRVAWTSPSEHCVWLAVHYQ